MLRRLLPGFRLSSAGHANGAIYSFGPFPRSGEPGSEGVHACEFEQRLSSSERDAW